MTSGHAAPQSRRRRKTAPAAHIFSGPNTLKMALAAGLEPEALWATAPVLARFASSNFAAQPNHEGESRNKKARGDTRDKGRSRAKGEASNRAHIRGKETVDASLRACLTRINTPSTSAELSARVGHEQHQGLVFQLSALPHLSLAELSAGQAPCLVVALDQIQDPHNLGAIARSAWAFGANALLVTRDHQAPLSDAAMRASAGALLRLPVVQVTNLAQSLVTLKDHHFWTLGLSAQGQPLQSASKLRTAARRVLVVGNEGQGLRPLTAARVDMSIALPMARPIDSLNASVAAACALFWLAEAHVAAATTLHSAAV